MDHLASEDSLVKHGAEMILRQLMKDPPPDHPIRSVPPARLLQKLTEGPDDDGMINFGHGVVVSANQLSGPVEKRPIMPGDVCTISGLVKRVDLNGKTAKVLAHVAANGRVHCEITEGVERVRLKLDNLHRVDHASRNVPTERVQENPDNTTQVENDYLQKAVMSRPPPNSVLESAPRQKVLDSPPKQEVLKSTANVKKTRAFMSALSNDVVYECSTCKAHRPLGYKCCGLYIGTMDESPVTRRNVHSHPEADEDEVDAFIQALL